METLFALFRSDIYKSKASRIFLGVFRSFEMANSYAKKYNCYTNESEVEIIEVEVDKFGEI